MKYIIITWVFSAIFFTSIASLEAKNNLDPPPAVNTKKNNALSENKEIQQLLKDLEEIDIDEESKKRVQKIITQSEEITEKPNRLKSIMYTTAYILLGLLGIVIVSSFVGSYYRQKKK